GAITLKKSLNIEGGGLKPGLGSEPDLIGTLKIPGNLTVSGNNFSFDIVPGTASLNASIIIVGNFNVSGLNKLIVSFKNNLPEAGTYTLIKCLGTLTAVKENFEIEGVPGVPKEILIENNEIKLKIIQQRGPAAVAWKGNV